MTPGQFHTFAEWEECLSLLCQKNLPIPQSELGVGVKELVHETTWDTGRRGRERESQAAGCMENDSWLCRTLSP